MGLQKTRGSRLASSKETIIALLAKYNTPKQRSSPYLHSGDEQSEGEANTHTYMKEYIAGHRLPIKLNTRKDMKQYNAVHRPTINTNGKGVTVGPLVATITFQVVTTTFLIPAPTLLVYTGKFCNQISFEQKNSA